MELEILFVISVLLLSALITSFILPITVWFSLKRGYKNTSLRHDIITGCRCCRLGGFPMIASTFLSILATCYYAYNIHFADEYILQYTLSSYNIVAILILFTTGVLDDIKGVKYNYKLFIQVVASILIICSGNIMTNLNGVFGIYEIPTAVGVVLTILIIMLITNAINFIDGLDGLAAMIAISAFTAFGVLFLFIGYFAFTMISFAMVGGLLTFAYYNIWGVERFKGVKIMMGDCGSIVVGFMLSIMFFKLWNSTLAEPHSTLSTYTKTIAYTMLAIPCMDAVDVILHRLITGKSIFLPDKKHIHHKLLLIGHSQHKALLILSFMNCGLLILNLLLTLNIRFRVNCNYQHRYLVPFKPFYL